MKKLINKPENVEVEMLEGMEMAHGDLLRKLDGFNVLVRADKKQGKVALVSGGGSGHEPAHGGYVGTGMLDGAVAGAMFTSPTPDQVFEAVKAVDAGKGVLLVIKNYTGDVLNFEMAADMAEMEGIKVDKVVVNDDVAVMDSLYTTGRRGVAGTVFVHKVAGAMAEQGAELAEVKRVAEKAIANVRTMGVALSACTVPAAGKPGFSLEEDEMEVGLGIHGEPGTHKSKMMPADEIVDLLLAKIFEDMPMGKGDKVAVMVNGCGGTPVSELYILNRRVGEVMKEKGIAVKKTLVGDYMTSLEMQGGAISILKLDDELEALLNEPANTVGLKI